jgi:phosphoribosyl-dephospho-CoA transferase
MYRQHKYRRHDLVWLTAQGWDTALRGLTGAPRELGLHWQAHGLPAVVRRTEPGTLPGLVCLGIPAPPDVDSGQKLRLGLASELCHVAEVRSALALCDVDAPPSWQLGLPAWTLRYALRVWSAGCLGPSLCRR